MAIDLTRFYPIFFAESLEQLDTMEAELLRPNVEMAGNESINTIFRAAHSIKGGSATFDFADIADLTHVMETLIDDVRSGSRYLDEILVNLLLESVDGLREVLHGYQDSNPVSSDTVRDLQTRIELMIGADKVQSPSSKPAPAVNENWLIEFIPHAHLLRRGNDPYRILRELGGLGELSAAADLSRLPPLADIDPESCYLSWTIKLESTANRSEIHELFEWVEGDCELKVEREFNALINGELELSLEADEAEGAVATEALGAPTGIAGVGAGGSIRVDTDKIDLLIDMVGELVINESILTRLIGSSDAHDYTPLLDAMTQFTRNLRDLQETALNLRMLPMAFCFSRLPRIVRDLGKELGKDARLELHGENTEVDKIVLEKITDPLIHLVRNAIDHGIEPIRQRLAAGKPSQATITVEVFHEGGMVIINVGDDGSGLDTEKLLQKAIAKGMVDEGAKLSERELHDLIFSPGFSTAGNVTGVSGRGVGLDIVRRNIQSLGGHVSVRSEFGKGAHFTIVLPLTLAIIDGQLVRIGDNIFVIPILAIVENSHARPEDFQSLGGKKNLYRFRDSMVPILDLARAWQIESERNEADSQLIVVIEARGHYIGLLVDELLDQQPTVIKSLESNFRAVPGISGATILGNGAVALILDAAGLIEMIVAEERCIRIEQKVHLTRSKASDEAHGQYFG